MRLTFCCLLFVPLLQLAAQVTTGPEIDVQEIHRRGDTVEYVTGDAQSTESAASETALAALAPPADDDHKWFITVIKQDNCPPCQQLLTDLSQDPRLLAFVQPAKPPESWAHFNVYAREDETQAWRWEKIRLRGYPTLLVQPPRNGRYGPAATVVLQKTGYGGDAAALARQLRTAITDYATKHQATPADAALITGVSANTRSSNHLPLITANTLIPDEPSDLGNAAPAPFAPPAIPEPLPHDPAPGPLVVPPQVDPDARPAPQPDPAPTPSPAPRIAPAVPGPFPQHPEAVVIVDKFADSMTDERTWARVRAVLQRLQKERPGLIVRLLDIRDAAQYPISPGELPAVITTSEGRIETKLDRRLLPLLQADLQTFPWEALLSFFTLGFNWAGLAAIGIWLAALVRQWRKARGQRLLLDEQSLSQLRELLAKLLKSDTPPTNT
ncbi:MAG: hypothetical protein SFX18_01660 [Pirellulales bacterium]|nr:hypothetical protein [Pirellulales bacterium]